MRQPAADFNAINAKLHRAAMSSAMYFMTRPELDLYLRRHNALGVLA